MWSALLRIVVKIISNRIMSLLQVTRFKKILKIGKRVIKPKTYYKILRDEAISIIEKLKRPDKLIKGKISNYVGSVPGYKLVENLLRYKKIRQSKANEDITKSRTNAFLKVYGNKIGIIGKLWKEVLRSRNVILQQIIKLEREISLQERKSSLKYFSTFQDDDLLIIQQERNRLNRTLKIIKKMLTTLEKEKFNVNQVNKNREVRDFQDFYNTLNEKEKINLKKEMENTIGIRMNFESSWIEWGLWIPLTYISDEHAQYKPNNSIYMLENEKIRLTKEEKNKRVINSYSRGLMQICTKKKPATNPSGIYTWWNITLLTYNRIIKDPTGTNFWAVFLHRNRKNMDYLLPNSIYWKKRKKRIKYII